MTWILPFLRLIKSVGWPPPWVFVRCLAPVLVWQTLSIILPTLPDGDKLAWAVVGYFAVFQWTRAPFTASVIEPKHWRHAVLVLLALFCVLSGLLLFAPDPKWVQRWFTGIYAVMALACLLDMAWQEGFSLQGLSAELVEAAGRQLMCAYFLFYLMLAALNETLIAHLSLQAWVLCLTVLPIFTWAVSRALTRTVWLSMKD